MTIFAGPFTTGNMDQPQWREVESKLWSDGVISGARNGFATTTTSGLGISVNTGDAVLDGFRFYADVATALTAATADPSLPRIDLVVLRIDESAHTATIAIKTGTPASSPVAPAVTKTIGGTYELGIYQLRVNAAATTIASLTDVRTYTAPGNAVAKSGDTMTGPLNGTTATFSSHLTANDANFNGANSGTEMGDPGSVNTPHIDMHSSGNANDFDARLIASGGTATNGQGTLNIVAASLQFNGATVSNNSGALQTNLNADMLDGQDASAFLGATAKAADSDKLDGINSTGFVQVGSGNQAATPVQIIVSDTTPAAGTKGRILIKVPFALP